MAATILFISFFLLHLLLLNSVESTCPRSFPCQNLGTLEFPLSNMQPECGLFTINCNSPNPILKLQAGNYQLRVRDPVLLNLLREEACYAFSDRSLSNRPSSSFSISPSITMYTCSNERHSEIFSNQQFRSYNCTQFTVYYRNSRNNLADSQIITPSGCVAVQMPIKPEQDTNDLLELLTANFTLEWNISRDCFTCHESGGQCINNIDEFVCKRERSWKNVISAAGISGGGGFMICLAVFLVIMKKY